MGTLKGTKFVANPCIVGSSLVKWKRTQTPECVFHVLQHTHTHTWCTCVMSGGLLVPIAVSVQLFYLCGLAV